MRADEPRSYGSSFGAAATAYSAHRPDYARAATAALCRSGDGQDPRIGAPEQAEFAHGQRRTADSLVATLGTRAGVLRVHRQ